MSGQQVRRARPADVPAMVALIHELAAYERAPEQVQVTDEALETALFGAAPAAYAHVAVDATEVVGLALWFRSFSTWLGRPGVYLEDLFVTPAARGRGLGKGLLQALAQECAEHGYGRLEWSVLDWNTPAHGFYRSVGAQPMDEWTVWRLTGTELSALAYG